VRLLCRELTREAGIEQWLVTRRASELARRAAAAGVAVRGVSWRWSWDPRALLELALILARRRPHLVHAHDAHAFALARYAIALAAPWSGRPPAVVVTRRVDFHLRRPRAWGTAACIVAVSQAVERVLVEDGLPRDRIRVIPDGVDPEEIRRAAAAGRGIRARLGLAPGAPLAVNVAALVDHKDQLTLIRAAAAARPNRPDLHWAIAGEGPRRAALQHAINELDLGSRVRLLGYIEEADALINEADILVMSSREEALGSVVLHALALDKPVVATRAGGLPEIVPADWLVPVGDAAALAAKVGAALDRRPPATLPERYSARAMVADIVATYRALT
jgi:glycosyltransferase involved in cell wall biosynthesis